MKAVWGQKEADEHHLHTEGALRGHVGRFHAGTPGRLGKPDSLSSLSLSPVAWLGHVLLSCSVRRTMFASSGLHSHMNGYIVLPS